MKEVLNSEIFKVTDERMKIAFGESPTPNKPPFFSTTELEVTSSSFQMQ